MRRMPAHVTCLAALFGLAAGPQPVRADVVKLTSGGEIRGVVDRETAAPDSPRVLIETLAGSVVVVERAEIEFITHRSAESEEYETRRRTIPDSVEAHWELAEWCRENNLRGEREEQLLRVVELDPDHEAAHRGLGHALRDGEWMSREEDMLARGYVKHKGDWVTPQELELLEQTDAERAREREWFKKVRLWHAWLTGRHAERSQQAFAELQKISDPYAVSALRKVFSDSEDKRLRSFYIGIVSGIPGPQAAEALVEQSLRDVDYELRYAALNGIDPEQYAAATPLFIRELRDDSNAIVRRAGLGLERVGDDQAVPQLIEALVTTHTYRFSVPDNTAVSVGAGGSFAPSGGLPLPPDIELQLRTGQLPHGVIVHPPPQPRRMKRVMVKRDHENSEILAALTQITGKNFGFDERTWRLWWNAEKSGATGNAPKLQ
jgi:hypothetical protein